jgi:hypothetical protein
MFAAETAVFVQLQTIRRVLLVFHRVVISLLAIVASEYDFDSHCGASFIFASLF